ncbi:MAG: serpin family protein [Bacillota bacterium]|nr:serpin family protein [Bacillota bacterium]
MKSRMMMMSLIAALLLAFTACSSPAAMAGDLMADVKASERPANPQPPTGAYTDAVADFSLKLLVESLNNSGNILVSPASVYLALAMTINGADGETRDAMMAALSSAGLSEELLNAASRDWITLLEQTGDKTELFISNSIWVRDGYPVDASFLQRNADFFRAGAYTLDFGLPAAVTTINDWVKTATRSKIDKIVDEIDPDVMMYLINAIYFKSDWKNPFAGDSTREGLFQSPDGEITVKYMNETASMDLIKQDDIRGIWLPYVDASFGFFAILPDEDTDVRDWIATLDSATLSSLIDARQSASVTLALPKFEVSYEDSLIDELAKLGMGVAFTGVADFSRMNAEGISDLFISEVKHKTFCRVDEKGTEAAAVTSVEMRLTSIPVSDETLNFDRPFLYGIMDTRTGVPLFLGIMEAPEA